MSAIQSFALSARLSIDRMLITQNGRLPTAPASRMLLELLTEATIEPCQLRIYMGCEIQLEYVFALEGAIIDNYNHRLRD